MEETDSKALLGVLIDNKFEPGERVLLGHTGTVQTLLSLVFGHPVEVRVRGQQEEKTNFAGATQPAGQAPHLLRSVELLAAGQVVCHAVSRIPVGGINLPEFISDVYAGKLGLGQIINKLRIPHERRVIEVGRDATSFWRSYRIFGANLELQILESFPRTPFVDIGWIKSECGPPSRQALPPYP